MDDRKTTKTYERYCLKYQAQQLKQLSNLFDKIAKDSTGQDKHTPTGDSTPTAQGGTNRVQQKTQTGKEVGLEAEIVEKMEASPAVKLSAVDENSLPCPLFASPVKMKNQPKRSKPAIHALKSKGTTKRASKRVHLFSKFQNRVKAAPRPSTPMVASTEYPSIETFRDVNKQSFDWSYTHREDNSCSSWLQSMTDSFMEKKQLSSSAAKQTPTAVRQHSFIKFTTPTPVATSVKRPQTVVCSPHGQESESSDCSNEVVSSFTTVYTWTTATGTTTDTSSPCTGISNKGKAVPQQQQIGEAEQMTSGRSPTLMLKTPAEDPLQSTAIHSVHIRDTPNVSPIRAFSDEEMHRTPSAPTHSVSPRGPRKTQSFLSSRDRAVPPKCSTMLFASPMADAGDAPLDVSSIKAALTETIDANEHGTEMEKTLMKMESHTEDAGDRVLTSTPSGDRSIRFKWNLSSVQLPEQDEEELLAMNSGHDTVNSEEIVARTLSDISLQDLEPITDQAEEPHAEVGEQMSPDASRGSRAESGVGVTSPAEDHSAFKINITHSSPTMLQPTARSHIVSSEHSHLHSGRNEQERPAIGKVGVTAQHLHISSRGDASEHSRRWKKFHSRLQEEATPTTCRMVAREKHIRTFDDKLSQQQEHVSSTEIRKEDSGPFGVLQQEAEVGSVEGREKDVVPPCPVSIAGMRGRESTPAKQQQGHKAGLLMCIESVDSGFMDMIANTPPDIIGEVSRVMKKERFPSPP